MVAFLVRILTPTIGLNLSVFFMCYTEFDWHIYNLTIITNVAQSALWPVISAQVGSFKKICKGGIFVVELWRIHRELTANYHVDLRSFTKTTRCSQARSRSCSQCKQHCVSNDEFVNKQQLNNNNTQQHNCEQQQLMCIKVWRRACAARHFVENLDLMSSDYQTEQELSH